MAELVDASDLKSLGVIRPGSTPGVPTKRCFLVRRADHISPKALKLAMP